MQFMRWLCRIALILFLLAGLSGCGGMMAFWKGNSLLDEGKFDEGLAKLEEAVEAEPKNAEYRITLTNRRTALVNRLIMSAEAAYREGRLSDAEKAYQQTLKYDVHHVVAKQGLEALVAERRNRQVIAEAEALFKKGDEISTQNALEKLRPVLAANPNQKEALNLKVRIEQSLVKEQKPYPKLAESFRKTISLKFHEAPFKSVFDVIATVSGLNFFFDKDVRYDQKISIIAKNTTVEDAVRLLLVTNQLEQKVLNENTILVYPNTPQKLQEYQSLSVRAFLLANSDVKAVSNTLKSIAKIKEMVIDERLGLIIVRDTPEAIRLAERIVALQDLSDPEVVLELEVMEIKRTWLLELGIQWPSQLSLLPISSGAAGTALTLDNLRNRTSATTQATIGATNINARKEDQNTNILANPRIRVRNKDKAKIMIGDRVPVITTTATSTGFASESISYIDVGLKLEVEPNIYLDEEVAIKVNLEVSSIVREVISKSGALSYQIGTRGANTVLRLKNGETQVLAGLISNEERVTGNRVPGLGDIPIIGRLFGSQKDDNQRSEILLAITPRVVRSIKRPDLLTAEFESGTANIASTKSLRLSTVEPSNATAGNVAAPGVIPGAVVGGSPSGPTATPIGSVTMPIIPIIPPVMPTNHHAPNATVGGSAVPMPPSVATPAPVTAPTGLAPPPAMPGTMPEQPAR